MIDTTPAIEEDGEEWHPHPLPDELVSRVAVVVNTHLHFDHCGGNRLFPGLPIHVQRRELAAARTEDDYTVREWVDFPGARRRPTSRMSRRCVSRTRGRSV
jgi:N-acyl homoserine lactone hydrolase